MIADLKPYPAMKDSGVPWLGEVPEHWEVRRLKHTFRRIVGGSTPSSTEARFWDGDVVWVTPADVSRASRLKESIRGITEDGLKSCSSELVPQGSIIVTSRAPVGNVAIAETELCTNQGCKALVGREAVVDPLFAFHVLKALKDELQSLATGTTFTEIPAGRLAAVAMPLPPLPEQAAIVRFLDYVDRRIRRYIRAKQKLIKLLEEQKQAIIHRAVTRGLDPNVRLKPSGVEWLRDVPEHWEVWQVGRFAEVGNGSTPSRGSSRYWSDGHYPWLNSSCANRENVTVADQFVTAVALRECHLRVVRAGSVLVAITGQGRTRGKAAVLRVEATINQHLAYITPREDVVSSDYLRLVFDGAYAHLRAISDDSGSTKGALTCGDLKHLNVALPPLAEQRRLVSAVQAGARACSDAVIRADSQVTLLREYGTRLIADVVTGKVDVREAAAKLPDEAEEPQPVVADEGTVEEGDEAVTEATDSVPEEAEG